MTRTLGPWQVMVKGLVSFLGFPLWFPSCFQFSVSVSFDLTFMWLRSVCWFRLKKKLMLLIIALMLLINRTAT